MKLDSREKYDKLRRFMGELKNKKNIDPFLDIEEIIRFGIYDFWYINKNPPSFAKIQKKIKESKYDYLSQFLEDLKHIFISVSDYAFSDDPIQQNCREFKEEIDKFGQTFLQEFQPAMQKPIKIKPTGIQTKVKPQPKQQLSQQIQSYQQLPIQTIQQPIITPVRPQPSVEEISYRERTPTLSQKLEMLFLLRANQNNQPYLRSIGTHYGMGMEIQDNYVLTISDKNKIWLQFIDKTQ